MLEKNSPELAFISYYRITNDLKNTVAENKEHRFSNFLWAKEWPNQLVVALSLLRAAKYQPGLQSPPSLVGKDLLPTLLMYLWAGFNSLP